MQEVRRARVRERRKSHDERDEPFDRVHAVARSRNGEQLANGPVRDGVPESQRPFLHGLLQCRAVGAREYAEPRRAPNRAWWRRACAGQGLDDEYLHSRAHHAPDPPYDWSRNEYLERRPALETSFLCVVVRLVEGVNEEKGIGGTYSHEIPL